MMLAAALTLAGPAAAFAADDILDAIEQARKSYQAGELAAAKQSLDLTSQPVAQKNAETFASLLLEALPDWKAEKAETAAVGVAVFGASSASRSYRGPNGRDVQVRITGDYAMVTQFAQLFSIRSLPAPRAS